MLIRELTFFCRQGLTISQAKQLSRLAGLFKSQIQLVNVTRRQTATATSQLALLTLGARPGDLCQLLIEGLDAELAHLAFNCWCVELGQPLTRPATAALAEQRLATQLPDYCFAMAQLNHQPGPLHKEDALIMLMDLLPANAIKDRAQLAAAIASREQLAATIIRPGLAMPHVISAAISQPAISVLSCATPIEWGSRLGPVQTMILLAIPAGLSPAMLRPLTRLARAMMDDLTGMALIHAATAPARQAIIIEGLLG